MRALSTPIVKAHTNIVKPPVHSWLVKQAPTRYPEPHTLWTPMAELLKDSPGDWAQIARAQPTSALGRAIRYGAIPAFENVAGWEGKFEARTVKNFWGTYDTFARFVAF